MCEREIFMPRAASPAVSIAYLRLGFGVWGLGLGVWGLGFGVSGFGPLELVPDPKP